MNCLRSLFALAVVALLAVPASAQWGDLKIKFIVDGEVPAQTAIADAKKDPFCATKKVVTENIVVGPNKELSNVFVYLIPDADQKVTVCPDLPAPADSVVLDNMNCAYVPRGLFVQTSQKLVLGNKDPIGHNVKGEFIANDLSFNDLIPAGGSVKKAFTKNENNPFPIGCNIHGYMLSYVLVRDNPYAAVSNAAGEVTIAKLPVGKWTFAVWHEGAGYVSSAKVAGKVVTWGKKGRMVEVIKAEGTDLGTVEIPLAILQKKK